MLTHRNLVANAFHKTLACSLERDDVLLAVAPLFHVAGTAPLLGLVWLGGTIVVLPSFDPAVSLDLIERHGVTVLVPVPTMVAAMVDEQCRRPRDARSLRLIGHAASPIPAEIVRRAHATFPGAELAHFYGATETSSVVTVLRHEERELDGPRLASCGQPVPGVEVTVVGPDDQRVAPGEVGEVLVRGPSVMAGYWEDPEATAKALHQGWYRTGDLGYLDEQSYLFLVDRAKDMIVSGGENVYSVEVENALYEHPAVAGSRGLRTAGRALGGGRPRRRRRPRGHVADPRAGRGAAGPLPLADRRLQGAEGHPPAHRAPAQVRSRQDPEAPAPRRARGRPRRADRLTAHAT